MTSTTIGLCYQNLLADMDNLPAGWDNASIAISGGWLLWGNQHSAEEILTADRDAVLAKMNHGLSDLRVELSRREGMAAVLDLEGGLRLRLGGTPLDYLKRIADAINLRVECAREFFGNTLELDLYLPGLALNGFDAGNQIDFANAAALTTLAQLGAFGDLDALWARCYAVRKHGQPGWQKTERMMRNTLTASRVAAAASGRPLKVICGLSWLEYGSRTVLAPEGLREQIGWAQDFDRIEVWAPGHEGSEVPIEASLQLATGVGLTGSAIP